VYVDETKAKGYVLAAAVVLPADVTEIRRTVRGLIAPGQARVHMKAEKTPRQHMILSSLVALAITVTSTRRTPGHTARTSRVDTHAWPVSYMTRQACASTWCWNPTPHRTHATAKP